MLGSDSSSNPIFGSSGRPPGRRWARWLAFRLMAVVAGLMVVVGGIEGSLRLFPGLFSTDVRSLAFAKYDTLPGGMYVKEKRTRMRFMKADFRTRAFSHGYFWEHRTDSLGFRNPSDLVEPDVLLLGDSFIYGHGVEEDETVGHFLRADHGIAAYNMAGQGQCLYEHTVLLNLYANQLQPETVILFAFLNDFKDLQNRRQGPLMEKIPEIRRFNYDEIRTEVDTLKAKKNHWLARAVFELGTVRLVSKWIHQSGGRESRQTAGPPRPDPTIPPQKNLSTRRVRDPVSEPGIPKNVSSPKVTAKPMNAEQLRMRGLWPGRVEVPILDPARFAPIARYYRQVLAAMESRCQQNETRLILVHLFVPSGERGELHLQAQRKLRRLLARVAAENDIEFFDTEDLFKTSRSNFLPGDGHFSADGHRRLARFIAEEFGLGGNIMETDLN